MTERSRERVNAPVCRHGVFVVGTDTGVGKTVVAAGLARMLRKRGHRVGVFKPFLAGDDQANDAQILARAAGMAGPGILPEALLDVVAPNRFHEPLAPGMAARRENRTVDLAQVIEDARGLGNANDVLVVEGSGGLLVPVTEKMRRGELLIDVVEHFGLPVVLVGRTARGTINHVSLSVNALVSRGIKLAGVVLSRVETTHDQGDNDLFLAIEGTCGVRPVASLPWVGGGEAIIVGSAARFFETQGTWETMGLPAVESR